MSVKAQSIFEGLHIGALFEEGFLQPISSSMEVLLKNKQNKKQERFTIFKGEQKFGINLNMMATPLSLNTTASYTWLRNSLGLCGQYAFNKAAQTHKETRQETAVIATCVANYHTFKTHAWMVNAHLC